MADNQTATSRQTDRQSLQRSSSEGNAQKVGRDLDHSVDVGAVPDAKGDREGVHGGVVDGQLLGVAHHPGHRRICHHAYNGQVPGYTLERSQCRTSIRRADMGAVPVFSVYPRAMPRSLPTASMDGLMSHTVTEDDAR